MNRKKGFISIEFLVVIIAVALIGLGIWFLWFIPIQDRAAVSVYRSSMKTVRSGMEICMISNGLLRSGSPGGPICKPNIAGIYPLINYSRCGTEPFFHINFQNERKWQLDTFVDKNRTEFWDCISCRLSCTPDGCEEIGECR